MKKWLCKIGLHSFKLEVKYNPIKDKMPQALCQWCGEDVVYMFGEPPEEFLNPPIK